MSNPFETPRFRYVVATPTREHGSPLVEYDQTIFDNALHVQLTPARKIHELELIAYSRGFTIWQRDILGRADPEVRRIGHNSISYTQAFTIEEAFAFVIDDSDERRRFLDRRRVAMGAAMRFLHRFAREPSKVRLQEWQSLVAECLATSLPVLFVDEAVHLTTRLALTSAFGRDAWNNLLTLLRSPYVRDVATRAAPPLPATKEWTSAPAAVPVPLVFYTYDCANIDAALNSMRDQYRLSDHVMKFCRAAPLVHFMSEETHYIFGSLVLAGNHLVLQSG